MAKIVEDDPKACKFNKIHSNHGNWILTWHRSIIDYGDFEDDQWMHWKYFRYKKDMMKFIENNKLVNI